MLDHQDNLTSWSGLLEICKSNFDFSAFSCNAQMRLNCEAIKLSWREYLEILKLFNMDQKFVKIAESELGETKLRRYQALKQFNEWLDKHPFIVNITRGENRILWNFWKIENNLNYHLRWNNFAGISSLGQIQCSPCMCEIWKLCSVEIQISAIFRIWKLPRAHFGEKHRLTEHGNVVLAHSARLGRKTRPNSETRPTRPWNF